jgi:thiol:disulfide interchange protein
VRHEVLGQVGKARFGLLAAAAAIALACSSPTSTRSPTAPAAPPAVVISRPGASLADPAEGAPLPESASPPTPCLSAAPCEAKASLTVIAWEAEERDARERARRRGLPLLIYVRADWSATALEMERKAWADPRVAEVSRRFVALKLDVSSAEGNAELYAQRYGIERIPSTLIVDIDGRTLAILAGPTSPFVLLSAMRRALE